MQKRLTAGTALSVLAIALLALLAGPAGADEETPWDKSFIGHEMWQNSLEEGLEMAQESDRHLLIDIYSRG